MQQTQIILVDGCD